MRARVDKQKWREYSHVSLSQSLSLVECRKKIENDVMELCLLIYIIYILDIGYAWL